MERLTQQQFMTLFKFSEDSCAPYGLDAYVAHVIYAIPKVVPPIPTYLNLEARMEKQREVTLPGPWGQVGRG